MGGTKNTSRPKTISIPANNEAFAASRQAVRQQVAFYGSTPSYRSVLELHGWHELGPELTQLSKRGKWVEMGERLPDEVLETVAVVAQPGEVGRELKSRFDGLVDSWTATFEPEGPDLKRELMQTLRG